MTYTVRPIAYISSPYSQKFGIPRQPNLVPAAKICIQLTHPFTMDCVRGLDEFDYIWVQFIFHDAVAEGWAQMVRPPRLGGKKKVGVFATRSPHRPNHIGLSLLKLDRIEYDNGIKIWCSGADLLDGTPVLDIKPYIPFVEAKPTAAGGFASEAPPELNVRWHCPQQASHIPESTRLLIEQSIAQDPRPAYQNDPNRIYVMEIDNWDIRFRIQNQEAIIISSLPI